MGAPVRFIARDRSKLSVCRTCIDKVTTQGTGLGIQIANCTCLCAFQPSPEDPTTSTEVCPDCGHAHATEEFNMGTEKGPERARMRLGFKPDK